MKQYLTLTFYILLFTLLTACGSTPNSSQDAGALTFNIKLSRPATAYQTAYLTGNDICIDYGVATVTAIVKDSSGKTITSGSWSCSAHQGNINGIPSGNNYTVTLEGKDSDNTVTWSGEKTGISISKGETTAAGTIAMTYVGNDKTAPTVTSTSPADSAPTVPVTSLLTATFSEKMAISSVNDKTFTLTNGTTPVSGSVTYDSSTKKAIFIPATNLSYSTTYTATITTGVEDMAGNNMQADKTWSFTTETQPTSAPSTPTGVVATAGNGQATITWDAVTGATSYNVYWSTTLGVTINPDTDIIGVTSPYIHTGRNNGTTYYYVVTAANDIYGESDTSAEVSVTPVATDTTPPTGSVIINNNVTYTNSTTVTLTLSATDSSGVSQMCISNESTCPSSSWETYTTSKSWTLTTGDGTKTVYAWFKDGAGNANETHNTDSITLDTTAPFDGSLSATAGDGQILLSWSGFSDATSGIVSFRLVYSTSVTPDTCSSGIHVYTGSDASYTHNSLTNGTKYYYRVCVVDNAGNASIGSEVSAMPQVGFALSGTMTDARYIHQATRIADGRVLVTGGVGISGAMDSAEIYDSSTGAFSQTGNMNMPRFSHTATLFSNGKVLIVGGRNNTGVNNASSYLSSAELYDPVTGTFSYTGGMSISRQVHTATLLQNGKVLITGGAIDWNTSGGVATDIAEIYDPTTGTFSRTGNLLKGNFFHTATLLDNGKVLISGGINSSAYVADELYDPSAGTFTATGSMSRRRYYHAATKLSDGKILITGGGDGTTASLQTAEVYDPATGIYSLVGNMNNRRNYHTSTLLSNWKVLITGGLDESGGNIVLNSAEVYDPATGTFSTTMNMADKRYLQTATPLIDGTVLMVGGDSGSGYLKSSELYLIGAP